MQPELSSEIRGLYQVLFETRQKLEFLNQIYKLRASLIDELLHPQFSSSACPDKQAATDSTSLMRKGNPQSLPADSLAKSVPPLPDTEPVAAGHDAFDFTQLDLLIQKAKKVRNVEEPKKLKKEDISKNNNDNKECANKNEPHKPSSAVSKSDIAKQPVVKPRVHSSLSSATPKSTYQSSYSSRPFLQQRRRGVKTHSSSLPPVRVEGRHTAETAGQELLQSRVAPREQLDPFRPSEDTQHSSPPNDSAPKLPTSRTDDKQVLSFPAAYAPPSVPPELAAALRDLRRAQVELATLLRTDHTKLLSPGKQLINEFESLHRGEETAEDRLHYARRLYSEIEAGPIPAEVKSFFLDSLHPHTTACTEPSMCAGFVYPCFHCTDPSACSSDGIQVPRSYLLRQPNLCSLLSRCYPGSPLARTSLLSRERLQCGDLRQFLELQLLVVDVFSLSVKRDVLAVCMKAVPALDPDRAEDRLALKVIINMLDSSKLISFFSFTDI